MVVTVQRRREPTGGRRQQPFLRPTLLQRAHPDCPALLEGESRAPATRHRCCCCCALSTPHRCCCCCTAFGDDEKRRGDVEHRPSNEEDALLGGKRKWPMPSRRRRFPPVVAATGRGVPLRHALGDPALHSQQHPASTLVVPTPQVGEGREEEVSRTKQLVEGRGIGNGGSLFGGGSAHGCWWVCWRDAARPFALTDDDADPQRRQDGR